MTSSERQDTHKTRKEFKIKEQKKNQIRTGKREEEIQTHTGRKSVGKKISEAAKVF
jgi:hypothetical protein